MLLLLENRSSVFLLHHLLLLASYFYPSTMLANARRRQVTFLITAGRVINLIIDLFLATVTICVEPFGLNLVLLGAEHSVHLLRHDQPVVTAAYLVSR